MLVVQAFTLVFDFSELYLPFLPLPLTTTSITRILQQHVTLLAARYASLPSLFSV
jgi:hypothetical protein